MIRPSFNLWRNILGDYVSPAKAVEFNAQLARLFTAFGHQWEPDPEPERQVEFTAQDRARHAIIKAEIQAGWTDEQRQRRVDGEESRERLKNLELAILRGEREADRLKSRNRSRKQSAEVLQLEIGYQD